MIADLTNTSWRFNETIDGTNYPFNSSILSLMFTSRGVNYKQFYLSHSGGSSPRDDLYYSTGSFTCVYTTYQGKNWNYANKLYREITITGGTYATNADFISWIYANAVPVQYQVSNVALLETANAIRTKGETSAQIEWTASGFADAIVNMVVPIPSDYGHISWDGATLTVS